MSVAEPKRWIDALISHAVSLRWVPTLIMVAPRVADQTAASSHNYVAYMIKTKQSMIGEVKWDVRASNETKKQKDYA